MFQTSAFDIAIYISMTVRWSYSNALRTSRSISRAFQPVSLLYPGNVGLLVFAQGPNGEVELVIRVSDHACTGRHYQRKNRSSATRQPSDVSRTTSLPSSIENTLHVFLEPFPVTLLATLDQLVVIVSLVTTENSQAAYEPSLPRVHARRSPCEDTVPTSVLMSPTRS